MKQYDLEKQKAQLKDLKLKLIPSQVNIIAGFEKCSPVTVRSYLNGDSKLPSLAEAIIDRANEVLKSK